MKNMYCEHGYLVVGEACSRCAPPTRPAVEGAAKPSSVSAPNNTLVELRSLKSMLQAGLIAEDEYDERRNNILATF